MSSSAIYCGEVYHRRLGPKRHNFDYRVYFLYLDLDELPELLRDDPESAVGALGIRFKREDYLGPAEEPLKESVLDRVESALGRRPGGAVRMLTQTRVLGYVFNPVSFYYCFDAGGALDAVVAEITNTPWGERHAYVLESSDVQHLGWISAEFQKQFHVSPFFPMDQTYKWRLSIPGNRLDIHMTNFESKEAVFHAGMSCERRALTPSNLRRVRRRHPLQPQRVSFAIYLQAALLWLKRVPFFVHPSQRPLPDSPPEVISADANSS